MAYSVRLSDAIHILVNITRAGHRGEAITSGEIAKRLNANPSQVRQMMGKLRKAGLINTSRGSISTHMAREPWSISVLDIYRAVEGDVQLLHPSKDPDDSTVSEDIQTAIGHAFDRIRWATDNEMAAIKLEDIMRDFYDMQNSRPPEPEPEAAQVTESEQGWNPDQSNQGDQGWNPDQSNQGDQGYDAQGWNQGWQG